MTRFQAFDKWAIERGLTAPGPVLIHYL